MRIELDINDSKFDWCHVLSDATTQSEHNELWNKIPDPWTTELQVFLDAGRRIVVEWLLADPEHMKRGLSEIEKKYKKYWR